MNPKEKIKQAKTQNNLNAQQLGSINQLEYEPIFLNCTYFYCFSL